MQPRWEATIQRAEQATLVNRSSSPPLGSWKRGGKRPSGQGPNTGKTFGNGKNTAEALGKPTSLGGSTAFHAENTQDKSAKVS